MLDHGPCRHLPPRIDASPVICEQDRPDQVQSAVLEAIAPEVGREAGQREQLVTVRAVGVRAAIGAQMHSFVVPGTVAIADPNQSWIGTCPTDSIVRVGTANTWIEEGAECCARAAAAVSSTTRTHGGAASRRGSRRQPDGERQRHAPTGHEVHHIARRGDRRRLRCRCDPHDVAFVEQVVDAQPDLGLRQPRRALQCVVDEEVRDVEGVDRDGLIDAAVVGRYRRRMEILCRLREFRTTRARKVPRARCRDGQLQR
jgi:hypothetical protein